MCGTGAELETEAGGPVVGPNAVWQAAVPPTVRVPEPSDAADAGPREHREVFVRLKYEILLNLHLTYTCLHPHRRTD